MQPASASNLTTRISWRSLALAGVACALTTLLTLPLHDWLDPVNTVMLFLLTVVLVATRLGRAPAVLASFLSVGLFDFFFVPPRWSFAVSDMQYLLTFVVMLTVALIIGHLTIGLRQQAQEAQAVATRSRGLYALASKLAGALSVEQVHQISSAYVQEQLQARLALLTPNKQEQLVSAQGQPLPATHPLALAAQTVYMDNHGILSHQISEAGELNVILPLAGSTRSRGVLIITAPSSIGKAGAQALEDQRPLLDAVASLVATSLERLHFVEVAHQTQLEVSSERLRNSILSALSHDIRTPLTSLFGLADTLTLMRPPLPSQAQEMAAAIRDQSMRLHRMVSNLLDMARLQSDKAAGQLQLKREWQPIEEVLGASIQLLGTSLGQHKIKVDLPANLPLLSIDAVLMERVFGNLLENASKYAPAHTDILVKIENQSPHLSVSIKNAGPGFPSHRLSDVFGIFERGVSESSIPGVGLGLAICKSIVEAHGGHIEARNPAEGGAEVRFTLPMGTPPTIEPEASTEGTR